MRVSKRTYTNTTDVLNFILIIGDEFTELFEGFSPYNILVDSDTGDFNKGFTASKDTLLGLHSLFT